MDGLRFVCVLRLVCTYMFVFSVMCAQVFVLRYKCLYMCAYEHVCLGMYVLRYRCLGIGAKACLLRYMWA